MLDDTLVIWGGELGRTPMGENRKTVGRDHHIEAFTHFTLSDNLHTSLQQKQKVS